MCILQILHITSQLVHWLYTCLQHFTNLTESHYHKCEKFKSKRWIKEHADPTFPHLSGLFCFHSQRLVFASCKCTPQEEDSETNTSGKATQPPASESQQLPSTTRRWVQGYALCTPYFSGYLSRKGLCYLTTLPSPSLSLCRKLG